MWPPDRKITVAALASDAPQIRGQIEDVSLLGSPQKVEFTRDAAGLNVTLPPWKPSDFANVLKITGLKIP